MAEPMTAEPEVAPPFALEMTGISKSFPGVKALDDVSLDVLTGEVHALVGENGAGKSTLMKILSGAYRADSGHVSVFGQAVPTGASPRDMLARDVAVIYQEFALAPHLTVAENIMLGRLPTARGRISWDSAATETRRVMALLGRQIDPSARVGDLSVADQQMVEIAKALSRGSRLIVLDEPSAVLGDDEVDSLFEAVRGLAADGVSFVYISHRLREVFLIADRVTVLRDGRTIETRRAADLNTDRLIEMMVGRELADIYPERQESGSQVALKAERLTRHGVLHNIDLEVRAGEIVGIAGLAGSGRTELVRAILRADPIDDGALQVFDMDLDARTPKGAIKAGLGLIPEDRKSQALFLSQSVRFNVSIAALDKIRSGRVLLPSLERGVVRKLIDKLRIRTPTAETAVESLSGGNQQKAVFARWIHAGCHVLLADEPTRGVDVGAKQEIYRLLNDLAAEGLAILMVSSELPELLGTAHRILVMHEGRLVADLHHSIATEELIMRYAAGHGDHSS